MIEFNAYASGSRGNLYMVHDGETKLLIEAGLPFKEVQRRLNYRLSDIAGCLISHNHADHAKAAPDLMKRGVDVYASRGTFNSLGLSGHRAIFIEAKKQFNIGSWTILPFDTEHDVEESLGFLIANKFGEKLLFITDSYYCKYRFKDLNIIAVECNYSMDILNENISSGSVPQVMKKRLMKSHFSLENVKEFFKANDLSKVQEIHLLHLSDNNSDEERFKREIMELTGKVVYIA
jgi:phosphoribosyl 1,2-cyclic phosphodiesterase